MFETVMRQLFDKRWTDSATERIHLISVHLEYATDTVLLSLR